MTDRAVVEDPCPFCGKDRVHDIYDGDRRVRCLSCNIFWYPDDPEPEPRALVALSEDRQWLVVQRPKEQKFFIYEEFHFDSGQACYGEYEEVADTGQDAHEVLTEWLEGQG